MTKIVSFLVDDYCGFEVSGPVAWHENRCLPSALGAERLVSPGSEELPWADFMSVYGLGFDGDSTFLASDRAWESMLEGRFGVASLNAVNCPSGYRLVLVAAKLDVIDFDRSVEMFPGYLEGLHVDNVADELAGDFVYTPVGANQKWLLCGDGWADRCLAIGLSGLRFASAVVG